MHAFLIIFGIVLFLFMVGYGLGAVVRDHTEDKTIETHHISLKEFGTGNGDDRSGWICSCRAFGFEMGSAEKHTKEVAEARRLNAIMNGGGHCD